MSHMRRVLHAGILATIMAGLTLMMSGQSASLTLADSPPPVGITLGQQNDGKPTGATSSTGKSIPGELSPIHSPVTLVAGGNGLQGELSYASSGSSIVVNFNDSSLGNTIGGFGAAYATSTDGGFTWSAKTALANTVPGNPIASGDPITLADLSGRFWAGQIYSDDGTTNHNCTNSFQLSTDGGRTFGGIVGSAFSYASGTTNFPDQPHPAIDRVNQVNGNPELYMSTRHFTSGITCGGGGGSGSAQSEMSCSVDGGVTWKPPTVIATASNTDFVHLATASDGSVYAVGLTTNGFLLRRTATDCNGSGANAPNFGPPATVASNLSFSTVAGLDRPDNFQAYVVVDRQNSNVAYVTFSADNVQNTADRDIFLVKCTFSGTTGTCGGKVRVNDDTIGSGRPQLFPAICIDPNDVIQMAWHDQRLAAGQNAIFHAEITNGGTAVGKNFRIDQATFPFVNAIGAAPEYGDYQENNDACDGQHLYVAWSSQINPDGTPTNTSTDVFFTVVNNLPIIAVSGSLDFGTVPAGTSKTKDVTVQNTGDVALTVNSVTFAGGSDPSFSVLANPGTPQTIQPSDSVIYTVKFAPPVGSSGLKTGTLNIASTDPSQPLVTVPASATVDINGAGGAISVSSTNLSFGGVPVDDRTSPNQADRKLVISNQASCCDLTISGLTLGGTNAGDFSLVGAPTVPFTIPGSGQQTLVVRFNPSAAGPRSATLTILHSDPNKPSIVVNLSGTGLIPAIGTSPASLIFPPTVVEPVAGGLGGATQNVTVTNNGQAELIVDTLSAAPTPPFSAPGPTTSPMRVAPSDSFVEPVAFRPTGSPARRITGTLTVQDNLDGAGSVSQTVPLCGEAVGRGIRVLAVDANGTPLPSVTMLRLQGFGTVGRTNVNQRNLSLSTIDPPTSCQRIQFQYENQNLPTTQTSGSGQPGSYYSLTVYSGSQHATVTFTLAVNEFRTIRLTIP